MMHDQGGFRKSKRKTGVRTCLHPMMILFLFYLGSLSRGSRLPVLMDSFGYLSYHPILVFLLVRCLGLPSPRRISNLRISIASRLSTHALPSAREIDLCVLKRGFVFFYHYYVNLKRIRWNGSIHPLGVVVKGLGVLSGNQTM